MIPPRSSPFNELDPEQYEFIQRPQLPREYFETVRDELGFFRRYYFKPARDLDAEESPDNFIDAPDVTVPRKASSKYSNPLRVFQNAASNGLQAIIDWHAPLLSTTVFRLINWVYEGTNSKSQAEIQRLVDEVLLAPDFDREHLRGFSLAREERRLDKAMLSVDSLKAQGWIEDTAYIPVPKENVSYPTMEEVPKIAVPGVLRRRVAPICRAICEDPVLARQRHFNAFEQWHRDPESGVEQRVLGEVYMSDAFLEEEARVRALPRNPEDGPEVEYVPFAIAVGSDGTHLTNFGAASMTPTYGWDLGLSKEIRCKCNSFSSHHFAYMPSVSPVRAMNTIAVVSHAPSYCSYQMTSKTSIGRYTVRGQQRRSCVCAGSSLCRPSGSLYWMTSLWMHTRTECWCTAGMELRVVYSSVSSHTQLITRRGMSFARVCVLDL